ncbi:MAG: S8 family serine peptidase, partial [Limisphaerales bacterium]
MRPCRFWRISCKLLLSAFLAFHFCENSPAKTIRLRDEFINPASAANRVVMTANLKKNIPASGLYLVQFSGPLSAARRTELRASGVKLIKYVPDDAFIARFNKVSLAGIGELNYVSWIGTYRSELKINPRLAATMRAVKTNRMVSVNILLSPSAAPAEIAAVRSLLASVQSETHLRQGIILRGDLSPNRLDALTKSDVVLWIENAPKRKLVDEAASKIIGGDDGQVATPTVTQQLGFDGSGVTVCVADTGLDSGDMNTMHPDLRGRVTGFQYYGSLTDGSDGYGHGTHCAGIIAGNAATGETDPDTGAFYGLGVASGADLFIERIFDDDANEVSPFPSDETLTRDAVRHGAKIGSNSWGNDVQGDYDIDAAQFDELVRDADAETPGDQPYVLEFSAGNAGPDTQTMDSPATAKNVIATGASENAPGTLAETYGLYADGADTMADFSSRGPCADGRIKPDLVAPGTWIASAASSAAPNEDEIAWTTIDNYYVYMGGTSMSGPHAAGAAAVFMQYYESTHTNAVPSPALVKAALINSADELDEANGGPGPVPNNDEGWGRITLTNIIVTNVITAPRYYQYLDQTILLTNSQVYSQHIFVQSSDQPLKITLAYTDVPGFPGAIPALVNDLDLEVIAPDGTLYRGNQFGAGESAPNPPTSDKLNNVEGIFLSQPAPGDYLVRVRASKIEQDARLDTAAIDQDFALVSSGNLPRLGVGFILLDRTHYTAPGVMQIEVFDAARAASNTVSVLVTNLTTHSWTTNLMHTSGNYGAFTGAVATVTGTASARQIQIANDDNLEADYFDSTGTKRVATAVADLVPPTISAVASTTDVGVLTITWQTGEPATSIVRYGTNSSNLNLAVTNNALATNHVVKLTRLIPGTTYYFLISSDDAAGNIATDNNSGAFYTFIGVATPTVLMVDAYDTAAEESDGSTVIPDSAYTNILASAGVSYGFWKVNARGYPQLADLKPFQVVIWRITDDEVNYGVDADGLPDPTATNNTLNAQQQFMIQNYLNGGGSFFMASMGILSQLGDVPFRRNVFHVAEFEQNPDAPAQCSDCDEDFGAPAIFGAPASIADSMNMTLDYSNYPSFDDGFGDVYGPDFSDTFTPSSDSTAVTFESVSGKPCGMSYPKIGVDSPGRVVFLSFPFDAIPTNGASPNNAVTLLRNIINFLAPGANGTGVIFLDNTTYTTNDVVTVEVGDADLERAGQTQASFVASSNTNRVTVTLYETTHPGLFAGNLTLVSGNAATNQLLVQSGDTITATYFDDSNNSNVTATATIDTVPPTISQVAAVTDYSNAKVTWLTSKPADSSVQYGESLLPDRSSYVSTLATNHAVTIGGLSANRTYYYQVASRDQAGNTTVDDNNGNLYTFQTLKAPTPPWFDNLEAGVTNWTVVPDPDYGSDINWTLGTPNNGLVSSAYSGTNAWGSDLNGDQNFFLASSYLYSPVIDLSGLQSATLTFWDVCDFSSPYEDGVVYVSTNSSTPPGSLPMVEDFSGTVADDWEQETVDLTPYVGKTIQVVFYYEGVVADSPVYGWLLDDIGITGVAGGGTINITKNLGQGTYTLSSLTSIGTIPIQSGV